MVLMRQISSTPYIVEPNSIRTCIVASIAENAPIELAVRFRLHFLKVQQHKNVELALDLKCTLGSMLNVTFVRR
jgi:hypothetical protein